MQSEVTVEYLLCEAESGAKQAEERLRVFETALLSEQRVSQVLRRENRQLRRKLLSMDGINHDVHIENASMRADASGRVSEQLYELDCEVNDLFVKNEHLVQRVAQLERVISVCGEDKEKYEASIRELNAEIQSLLVVQRYVSESVDNDSFRSMHGSSHFKDAIGADTSDLSVLLMRSAEVFESLSSRVLSLEKENEVLDAALRDTINSAEQKDVLISNLTMTVDAHAQRLSGFVRLERTSVEDRERRCRVELEYMADTFIFNLFTSYFVPRLRVLESKQSSEDVRVVFEACEAAKREGKLAVMMLKERSFIDESRLSDAVSNKHSHDVEGLRRTTKELHLHNSVLQRSCEEWRKQSELQVQESTDEIERVRSSLSLQLSLVHVSLDEQNSRVRELSKKTDSLEKENRTFREKMSHQFAGFDAFTQTFEDDWTTATAREEQRLREASIARLESLLTRKDLEIARLEGALQGMEPELASARARLKSNEVTIVTTVKEKTALQDELSTLKNFHADAVEDIKRGVVELSQREREIVDLRQHVVNADAEIDALEVEVQRMRLEIATLSQGNQDCHEADILRHELSKERAERERVELDIEELQRLLTETSTFVADLETPQRTLSPQRDFFSPLSPPTSSDDGAGLVSIWNTLLDGNSFDFLASGSSAPHDLPTVVRYVQWLQVSLVKAQETANRQDIELTTFKGLLEFSPQWRTL